LFQSWVAIAGAMRCSAAPLGVILTVTHLHLFCTSLKLFQHFLKRAYHHPQQKQLCLLTGCKPARQLCEQVPSGASRFSEFLVPVQARARQCGRFKVGASFVEL
jgi:hypothetical protein